MFKRFEQHGKMLGYRFETKYALFFFGSRFLPRTALSGTFPQYQFSFLQQVHGNKIVEAAFEKNEEADAHFTSQRGLALISQSADCVPILLANESVVCAIHSGWKGTAQNIVAHSRAAFKHGPPLLAAIGPHLLPASFEVGLDVAQQLLNAAPEKHGLLLPHPDPRKTYFDLTELVRRQLRQSFGDALEIHECLEDTQTSVQFHSYRREKQQAGRQYSFVVLKA